MSIDGGAQDVSLVSSNWKRIGSVVQFLDNYELNQGAKELCALDTEEVIGSLRMCGHLQGMTQIDVKSSSNGTTLGMLMADEAFCECLSTGAMETPRRGNALLVIDERDLPPINAIAALCPGEDWVETALADAIKCARDNPLLKDPMLKEDEAQDMYRRLAMHVLTSGWKAEQIWRWTADAMASKFAFKRVPPIVSQRANISDGGIDDLRRTSYGFCATQVKGGTTYGGLAGKKGPLGTALKFFKVKGSQAKISARKTRLRYWPCLGDSIEFTAGGSLHSETRADDALIVNFLSFGRDVLPLKLTGLVGECVPWTDGHHSKRKRTLFVNRLDVVVIRRSDEGSLKVDLRKTSFRTEEFLSKVRLIH